MTCLEQFCDIQLPPEVDLCQAHENERESGLIDECPTCGVYKDVKYETCLQCKRSGKTAQTTPIPRYDPASTASTISDLAADQKAHERRAAMKSYLATVSAWIALATLWVADCLIQLMLRTRSNERTVRATKRVPWPKGLRQELMRRQGNRCVCCGCRLSVYNCEIDHMDPVIRGGSNDKDNLQVLCRPCNMRKGPQTDQEFRERYARLVPRTRRTPPSQPVPQAAFNAETQRTRQSSDLQHFRKTRFISSREKIFSGSLASGGITGGAALFGLAYVGTEGWLLLLPAAILGGGVSVGLWLRARVTGVMILGDE